MNARVFVVEKTRCITVVPIVTRGERSTETTQRLRLRFGIFDDCTTSFIWYTRRENYAKVNRDIFSTKLGVRVKTVYRRSWKNTPKSNDHRVTIESNGQKI